MTDYTHLPVMPRDCLDGLNIKPDGTYIDGTVGLGGHAELICERLHGGRFIGLDKDAQALKRAETRLARFDGVTLIKEDFRRLEYALEGVKADGILLDIGVSSMQLDDASRGFSYRFDAPLDMRMDNTQELTAAVIVNTYSQNEIRRILHEYGEERFASRLAAAIVRARPLETTFELCDTIKAAMPSSREKQHPARRTFQALRIAVNDELGALSDALDGAVKVLAPGGRLCVISFHSLEDRLVKTRFKEMACDCVCPPDFPACVCGKKASGKVMGSRPPSREEIDENPRSECARLRVFETALRR